MDITYRIPDFEEPEPVLPEEIPAQERERLDQELDALIDAGAFD